MVEKLSLAHQARNHMACLHVEIIARAVKVTRHRTDEVAAILPSIAFHHLNPGNLGHSIRLIGRLQISTKQIFLFNRLRTVLWIDTA